MRVLTRSLFASTLIAGAIAASPLQASAAVIDFDEPALAGLYFAGQSFQQSGFNFAVNYDFGTVDLASKLDAPPSGNSTQFYTQLNEGFLTLTRADGGLFNLNSFDAAFVPLVPAASGQTTIAAVGTKADGKQVGWAFLFAPAAGGSYQFAQYSGAEFSVYTNLKSVEFFACSLDGGQVCTLPLQNNGQFALDNINVTAAVPEPSAALLLGMGLAGMGWLRRRQTKA